MRWRWKVVLASRWREKGHINVLEGYAALLSLTGRLRNKRAIGSRCVHLADSAVAIGVLTKKRSTSFLLNRVARKTACMELAGSINVVYAFCRSARNHADAPSRLKCRKRLK